MTQHSDPHSDFDAWQEAGDLRAYALTIWPEDWEEILPHLIWRGAVVRYCRGSKACLLIEHGNAAEGEIVGAR